MEEECKKIFQEIGLDHDYINGSIIPRDLLLCASTYEKVKKLIPNLKASFSSSFMTGLHKNSEETQKWPLLNLVRQLLSVYGYKMSPIRTSDGYTKQGVKKYKRFFQIEKI